MSIPSFQPKGKGFPKYYGFRTFADPGCAISLNGSFRDNIHVALHQFAELGNNLINGNRIWLTFLVHDGGGFVVPLYTVEERCFSPESIGWSRDFLSERKYHLIIPSVENWKKPPSSDFLDLNSHLLHGLMHCNGLGHLLCINRVEEGFKWLCGREIMDLWSRICTCLHTRKIMARDVSKKHKMDLRLLDDVAYGHPWCERWEFRFLCGSFGVKNHHDNRARELLSSLELNKIIQDFSCTGRCKEVKHITRCYGDLSETNLVTFRDAARSVTRIVTQSFGEHKSGKCCKFSGLAVNGDRPVKRLEFTANVIVESFKLEQAENNFSSSLMVRQEVHDAARQQISDNGLIDCVLKSVNNVVVGTMPKLNYMIEELNMCQGECNRTSAMVTEGMVAEELIVGFPHSESELISGNDSNLLFKVLRPATSAVGQGLWESKISLQKVSLQEEVQLPIWVVLSVTGALLIIVLYKGIQIGAQLVQSFKKKGSKRIGKVTVREKIGAGSHGSEVFKGLYGKREVAVKVVPKARYEVALREINNLVALDKHPNVVRYFGGEEDSHSYYICLEMGACTLGDLVMAEGKLGDLVMGEGKTVSEGCPLKMANLILEKMRSCDTPLWTRSNYPTFELILRLRCILEGLRYLHRKGMVHGDITPRNILVVGVRNPCFKLSDMGFTKKEEEAPDELFSGSENWLIPESVLGLPITQATDIYKFAYTAYYSISKGEHPYCNGMSVEKQTQTIEQEKEPSLWKVQDFPDVLDLLQRMLALKPEDRPTAARALQHPLFWPAAIRLEFFSLTSDWLKHEPRVVATIETEAAKVLGKHNPWNNAGAIPGIVITDMRKTGTHYKYKKVKGLLRLIRNINNHYFEMSSNSKAYFGDSVYGVESCIREKFPHLLMEVYKVVEPLWDRVQSFEHFRNKIRS